MVSGDADLIQKLVKLQELFRRTDSPGERAAAEAAIGRLRGRMRDARSDPEIEMKFSLPDGWSVRLFVAVCRKHGLHPYRYSRQRRTTVMVRAREREFDRVVWREYCHLQDELELYFEDTVDYLITSVMRSDGDDSGLESTQTRR